MEDSDLLNRLTPHASNLLNFNHKALIEAAIWRMLDVKYLSRPCAVYQIQTSCAIEGIDIALRSMSLQIPFPDDMLTNLIIDNPAERRMVTIPMYNAWRTQTGKLLHQVYGDAAGLERERRSRYRIAADMAGLLLKYSSSVTARELCKQLTTIVKRAAVFSKATAQAEGTYLPHPGQAMGGQYYNQKIDKTWMDVESKGEESGNDLASLVISPGLAKWTISPEDGRETPKMLVNARVC